ncbi:perlucin-like protein isoform X2 [Argopecten irradians]|uniref:perlucin-like protein isoform X2 n=1 Tax=Argopecten irradians TaxID=31199 RepID=UPI00371E4BE0
MPGIRQLLKEDLAELRRRRQQEMLDAIRGGFVLTCPYGWVYHDDNCYLFTQHRSTWQNMREHCNARGGGYLAEIGSREENEFVKEELRKRHQEHTRGSVSYFLGGTDREREGVWKWIRTGELIEFKDFKPPEPNNDKSEHCLTLFEESDFGWNDDQCDKKLHGICKISVGYKFT